MKKKEFAKRLVLCIVGLFFSALGIACTKTAGLGVAPISTMANVLNIGFPALSIGTWLTVCNCVMVAAQIVILRKDFKLFQLLQIPLSFLFGYFTDFGMWCISWIPVENYLSSLVMLIAGVAVLGFGITIAVTANLIMNSGEALVKAIADTWNKNFSNVKIAFDVGCVLAAAVLSLVLFDFSIRGIREGTLIAAVSVGLFVKLFNRVMRKPLEGILTR